MKSFLFHVHLTCDVLLVITPSPGDHMPLPGMSCPFFNSDKPPSGTHMPHPVLTQSSPPSSSLPPPPPSYATPLLIQMPFQIHHSHVYHHIGTHVCTRIIGSPCTTAPLRVHIRIPYLHHSRFWVHQIEKCSGTTAEIVLLREQTAKAVHSTA